MTRNEGATKATLLTDCGHHDQKNKFILERMMHEGQDERNLG
jgi:hypothetical protein